MNATRFIALILPAVILVGMALPSFAVTDEIDRGLFKMIYSRDTKQIHMAPIALKELQLNPRAYLDLPVKVRIRFHRIEKGLFVPEFTPFSTTSHINFSAWDADAQLWDEGAMKKDFPLMFVTKDTQAAQDLVRLHQFDIVEVFGEVVSLFEDRPWFEVSRIWLEEKSPLTNTVFSHIRLAEDMFEKGMYKLTVGELNRILRYELSGDLAGMLFKRKGESLLALRKFTEAARAFTRAKSVRPNDAVVYRGLGTSLMYMGEYETALITLENSLVFQAKQAIVYARMGYCRGKIADEKIIELSADKDYLQKTKPEDIRRREKKVRAEYDPGRLGVTEKIRERFTEASFKEVVAMYDLAILDCRKALFIEPTNRSALQWVADIENRLSEFKKKYAKKPPRKAPARSGARKKRK